MESKRPICIDLDGTLIRTDLLIESIFQFIKLSPLNLFKVILWALKGKASLKHNVSSHVKISPESLPYNQEVLDFCLKNSSQRPVYLVTGASKSYADAINENLGCFHGVYGSDEKTNLVGAVKAEFLKGLFPSGYEYIGDSSADIHVWKEAVGGFSVKKHNHGGLKHVELFPGKKVSKIKSHLKLVRWHQWIKNLLVFVPLLLAHKLDKSGLLINAVFSFISFCFMASSVYVLNDFLDVWSDRAHPKKRLRPIAAGQVSLVQAAFLFLGLFSSAVAISFSISALACTVLTSYFLINILYSFYLKRMLLVDIFILTSFYIFRVMYGAVATGVPVSYWLVAFSFFIFLSLAFLKRYAELQMLFKHQGRKSTSGRDYHFEDTPVLMAFGVVTGVASVLVLALYIHLGNQFQLYSRPQLLWGIEVLVLYWISLFWVRATRGQIEDDPVKYAIGDKVSWVVGALALCMGVLAV